MNFTCIVSEFNPITKGHEKIINFAKEKTANPIMCIMSGNFVQRGEPAILDKYTRAKLAIDAGADIVIELPTIYALSSATDFAFGAIKTISALTNVEYLVFGSECGKLQELQSIKDTINIHSNSKLIKEELKKGTSYANTLTKVLNLNLKSNDILAVEYLNALKSLNSKITPLTLKREDNFNLSVSSNGLASASAIRTLLKEKKIDDAYNLSPLLKKQNIKNITNYQDFNKIVDFKLKTEHQKLKKINGVSEGIENYIIENFNVNKTNIKTKRYPETKINRILCNFVLDIPQSLVRSAKQKNSVYIKVLAINNNKKDLLKHLPKNLVIVSKKDETKLNKIQRQVYEKDILASKVFSCINDGYTGKEDYTNKL